MLNCKKIYLFKILIIFDNNIKIIFMVTNYEHQNIKKLEVKIFQGDFDVP